jgi:DNA-binding MarR family transcriptional regulator
MMAKQALRPMEAHLGYWLRLVSNHVSQAIARKVESYGVTVAEWVVLRELFEKDDVAPSALAARLGVTRGAVSKLAERLAAKSLIAIEAGETDRRTQALTLKPAGRKLVPLLYVLADRNDAEFFGHLGAAERESLAAMLQGIAQKRKLRAVPLK